MLRQPEHHHSNSVQKALRLLVHIVQHLGQRVIGDAHEQQVAQPVCSLSTAIHLLLTFKQAALQCGRIGSQLFWGKRGCKRRRHENVSSSREEPCPREEESTSRGPCSGPTIKLTTGAATSRADSGGSCPSARPNQVSVNPPNGCPNT